MSSILCLAHFCDTHGPTPLMVTEGLPVQCNLCFQDELLYPETTNQTSPAITTTDSRSSMTRPLTCKSSTNSNAELQSNVHSLADNNQRVSESPPSPSARQSAYTNIPTRSRNCENLRKKRKLPCENCALTLPETKIRDALPAKLENSSPIMRTRKLYERVSVPLSADQISLSLPKTVSEDENSSSGPASCPEQTTTSHAPRGKSCTSDISLSAASFRHDHYLDYTSTHEPLEPTSFFIVRQSCLRTLSCETLPPSSIQPKSVSTSPCVRTILSSASSALPSSGGPIFFGDPHAGYTTAYIFRIPDPNVRGHRRVYALMALTKKRERTAMQSFSYFSTAFRELAQWILTLAELELERTGSPMEAKSSSTSAGGFFTGGRTSYESSQVILKNRGLAEILGMPDFFIELHTRFVRLLAELSIILRS